jgi:hypothetical protein
MADQFQARFAIEKVADEQQIVFGWLYVSETADGEQVIDHSGEYIVADDLELAAYDYVLSSRAGSLMHEEFYSADGTPVAQCCESVVTTREKQAAWGLPDGALQVGWWVGFKIYDASVWALVKSGDLSMFSIGGSAVLSPDAPSDTSAT